MERLDVIQQLISKRNFRTYLEIGVLGGHVFFKVKCRRKIAVDPNFRFNWRGRVGETIRNPHNLTARFFETTSDDFFARHAAPVFADKALDIVLIDGMHDFAYVNRDIDNSLQFLSPHGIIVLHDCNPLSREAACSFGEWKERGYSGYWNGDVWKSIVQLRASRPDLDVFVADCDHGLGIVTRGTGGNRKPLLDVDVREIGNLTFDDLVKNREAFLNLQPIPFLSSFLNDR